MNDPIEDYQGRRFVNLKNGENNMKNYELIWAREWAGLTQAQAAEKMGVHRVTFTQWETGARAMPTRKWQLFLKCVAINPQDIPKHLAPREYDNMGYPVGFNEADYDVDFTGAALEAALRKIEGNEYEARDRERYRLLMTKFMSDDAVASHMANYDEETRRLAAGMPARPYYEVYTDQHDEETRRRLAQEEYERLLSWQRDPEGMAQRMRDVEAKRPAELRWNPEQLENYIRGWQSSARNWLPRIAELVAANDLT
jgi:DNA-binding XRE family transcriptional regulator